ncbi:MAG TPA: DNA topoisomerase IB, partial [Gemmataceae bacterium]
MSDAVTGIRREKTGKTFQYIAPDGSVIRRRKVLSRIRALVIPPAWTKVWICPSPHGHIQATGRDALGRKQYRYHPRWVQTRDATKYHRMAAFGRVLPRIRARTAVDLLLPGMPRAKVLALVVRLLEATRIRIGNEEYRRQHGSIGLTTMRDHHVAIRGSRICFSFQGKSGIRHRISLRDCRLAPLVQRCQDLPGQALFQYLDAAGVRHAIDSSDVNEYLGEITGLECTAKDFRTWAGTLLAVRTLRNLGPGDTGKEVKRKMRLAIQEVAHALGNTQTVCRKCYIHPAVFQAYEDAALEQKLKPRKTRGR